MSRDGQAILMTAITLAKSVLRITRQIDVNL
jgi:hypothetical protein